MTNYRSAAYGAYSQWKNYLRQAETGSFRAKVKNQLDAWLPSPEEQFVRRTFPRSARILELGSGSGAFLQQLRKRGYRHLVGVDRAYLPDTESSVRFYRADIFEFLSQETGKHDLIMMLDVLEHFSKEEAIQLLTLCRSRLAAGGMVLCRVPNAACTHGLRNMFGDITHELYLNASSVGQLSVVCGYDTSKLLKSRNHAKTFVCSFRNPLDLASLVAYLLAFPVVSLLRRGSYVFHGGAPGAFHANLLFVLKTNVPG
jgi:2-polyprenyl-3-methyl-5-hydroxy-6-metoxy-1,4-benzoquinol methylase